MTRPIRYNDEISSREIWNLSMQWVAANRRFIRMIASPFLEYMAADRDDLYQEATIAAYQAFTACLEKGESNQFIPYFRVIFKTSCLKMASGVRAIASIEDYQFTYPEKEEPVVPEPEQKKIEEALKRVTRKQRIVCAWLLQQQEPVRVKDISKQFNVSLRHAFRMMSDVYERISLAQ